MEQDQRTIVSTEGQREDAPLGMNGEHRTPYMEWCREMGFDEHADFISECLDRLYDPDPAGERPHSMDEFRMVWRLLRQKQEAMPPDPPPPLNPLQKARAKRERTESLLYDEAPGNPTFKKKHIKRMRQTLDSLDREIEKLEASGKYDYTPPPAPETPRRAAGRTVSKLLGDIVNAFKRRPTGRFQWRPLPPGEASPQKVRGHYRERLRHEGRLDKFDQGRLDVATALPYEEWWVPTEGFGGFDAYSIISFSHTDKVLLECPIYGNAAYVIDAEEEVWREMTKQELAESGLAEKIPHRGDDWPKKVRRALDLE